MSPSTMVDYLSLPVSPNCPLLVITSVPLQKPLLPPLGLHPWWNFHQAGHSISPFCSSTKPAPKPAILYREQTNGCQWWWWEGQCRGREVGVQTTGYKRGSGMYCTTQETEPITGKNCTWRVTFKHWIKSIVKEKLLLKKKTKKSYPGVTISWGRGNLKGNRYNSSKLVQKCIFWYFNTCHHLHTVSWILPSLLRRCN